MAASLLLRDQEMVGLAGVGPADRQTVEHVVRDRPASISKEFGEAGIIDGASWFQTLTRIFIPVALPGLIAATIFAFTVSGVARKLAGILHRMWVSETDFHVGVGTKVTQRLRLRPAQ